MIALETLQEMFASMRSAAHLKVESPLLWGYFFFDGASEPLETLSSDLTRAGYNVVRLERTDDESSYVLHVERIEEHTPHSLFERNLQLEALARTHGVASYDGMDVGPVPHGDERVV